jgi:predicted amidophosphoribosyltransferase
MMPETSDDCCPTCKRKLRQKRVKQGPTACAVCNEPLAYSGRGAPRKTCMECRPVWAKLRYARAN